MSFHCSGGCPRKYRKNHDLRRTAFVDNESNRKIVKKIKEKENRIDGKKVMIHPLSGFVAGLADKRNY